jgi:hypothetical protein
LRFELEFDLEFDYEVWPWDLTLRFEPWTLTMRWFDVEVWLRVWPWVRPWGLTLSVTLKAMCDWDDLVVGYASLSNSIWYTVNLTLIIIW